MPRLTTEKALELMGGKLYASKSRLLIAEVVDELYMHGIRLFDLTSVSRVDRWLMGYARVKMFQKLQTLFQMGKKKELLELLDYAEKAVPDLRRLANNPDVFVTVSGKHLDPASAEKAWNKPLPGWVRKFMESTGIWRKLIKKREATG